MCSIFDLYSTDSFDSLATTTKTKRDRKIIINIYSTAFGPSIVGDFQRNCKRSEHLREKLNKHLTKKRGKKKIAHVDQREKKNKYICH